MLHLIEVLQTVQQLVEPWPSNEQSIYSKLGKLLVDLDFGLSQALNYLVRTRQLQDGGGGRGEERGGALQAHEGRSVKSDKYIGRY